MQFRASRLFKKKKANPDALHNNFLHWRFVASKTKTELDLCGSCRGDVSGLGDKGCRYGLLLLLLLLAPMLVLVRPLFLLLL